MLEDDVQSNLPTTGLRKEAKLSTLAGRPVPKRDRYSEV